MNVRGLGRAEKRWAVKELVVANDVDMFSVKSQLGVVGVWCFP